MPYYDPQGDLPTINWNGPPITGGGDGSGGGAGQFDWRSYLSDWGFPPDVIAKLDQIFKQYANPQDAASAALAYIRGTDWYRVTFPGIQEGIRLGIIGDERDYRSYVNQLNQFYRRFYNRDISSNEVSGYLKQGWGVTQIGQHLTGQALVGTSKPQIQYAQGAFGEGQLTDDQLAAYGDTLGGLDNGVGMEIQKRVAAAQQRMQRIFQGSLATPSLSLLNNGARLGTSGAGSTNALDVPS